MDKNAREFSAILHHRTSVLGEGTVFTSYHVITPLDSVHFPAIEAEGLVLPGQNHQLHKGQEVVDKGQEDEDFMEDLDFFLDGDGPPG